MADKVSVLWKEFQSKPDPGLRECIIENYLPFAKMLAAKAYAKRTFIELEFLDYLQYASIGLIEAVDRFDPARDVKFETFAAPRITGSILNGLCSLSERQEQVHARRKIISDRIESLKYARSKSHDPHAVFSYLAEVSIGIALGFVLEDSSMYQADEPIYPDNTYEHVELKQMRQGLKRLLKFLPENERKVISYHYQHQLSFDEITRILGLTKGRISQIHKSALQRLRNSLSNQNNTVDFCC